VILFITALVMAEPVCCK